MSPKAKKFWQVCLVLLVLTFFGYQLYAAVYKPITTATAVSYSTYDGIGITGYFVRDEVLVQNTANGVVRYVVSEGEKVSKGGVIAEVYQNAAAAASVTQAADLRQQIETLEAMNSVTDPSAVDLDTLNNRIRTAYISLLNRTDNGSLQEAAAAAEELRSIMNKKQIVTGGVTGFDALLSSLKTKLSALEGNKPQPLNTVKAQSSGFFVPSVDGLETVLTPAAMDTIDEQTFNTLTKTAKAGNGFGKIVSDYTWYIVAKMDNDQYLNFNTGNTVRLKTAISGCEELEAQVYRVQVTKNKDSAIVVLKCSVMNGEIATTRSAAMTVINESYDGIKISKKSVRVVNGATGVYVMQGSTVKFKPVNILYTGDNYVICEKNETGDTGKLRLYDEVIEKGKDLYDGKFIQ